MSLTYKAVNWNPHKRAYDATLAGACLAFLLLFVAAGLALGPPGGPPADQAAVFRLLIAATGALAAVLLHVVLAIGPLHRLDRRFAALLYNRRHLGVTLFLVATLHFVLVLLWYGIGGPVDPLSAVLGGPAVFPLLGFVAWCVFFVMAATSHDFWLANLGPGVWKALHMLVYAAYALVILHVALGAMRDDHGLATPAVLIAGVALIGGLHIAAAVRSRATPDPVVEVGDLAGWIDLGDPAAMPDGRGRVVCLRAEADGAAPDDRVAVFRDGDAFSAISNVCRHQGGPLGEGAIVDGCVTCPWHGYQYDAAAGRSPPPYHETVETYELRVVRREGAARLVLNPEPNAPGTPVEPARLSDAAGAGHD